MNGSKQQQQEEAEEEEEKKESLNKKQNERKKIFRYTVSLTERAPGEDERERERQTSFYAGCSRR